MEKFVFQRPMLCGNNFMTIFVTSLLLNCCHGFFPNQYSPLLKGRDYTHAEITQIGILKAVAGYFETVAAPGQATVVPTGNLTGITDITARKLYDAYYGESVSERRFQEAINDIIKYNNMVDQDHYTEAAWHFNGERITEGNAKLKSLRDTALNILSAASPDYEAARSTIGSYLHILQMFYSNTNWVEMKGGTISQDLGRTSFNQNIASPTTDTCMSCGLTIMPPLPCFINLLLAARTQLTSGYKGGQDVTKPFKDPATNKNGKCSHGGPTDQDNDLSAAIGGINKDTTNSSLSPHFSMHKRAADAAIEHTTYFFTDPSYGLLNRIGKDKFEQLLHLKPGKSLVFVIDSSGSMSADIAVITQKTRELVTQTQNTANKPFNYILVTFSDPETRTQVQQSTNPNDILSWLGHITPAGGSDCPEFSLSGLQAACVAANANSRIIVFTDATPKDPEKRQFIQSLSKDKNIRIDIVITGSCDGKQTQYQQKRSAVSFNNTNGKNHQHMRSTTTTSWNEMDVYKLISQQSGGHVYETTKQNIGRTIDFIKSSITDNYVDILRYSSGTTGNYVDIPIDVTCRKFALIIKADKGMPDPVLIKPGSSAAVTLGSGDVTKTTLGGTYLVLTVNNPTPGMWSVRKNDLYHWQMEVTAESKVDFTPLFLELGPDGLSLFQIKGKPTAGTNHTVSITMNDMADIQTVSDVFMLDIQGREIAHYPLKAKTGQYARNIFTTKVTVPSEAFQTAIEGTDSSGNHFRRINPSFVNMKILELQTTPTKVTCCLHRRRQREKAQRIGKRIEEILN